MNAWILAGTIATGILFGIALIGWMVELVAQAQRLLDARDGERSDV
jgi:hypothetical protein